MLATSQSKISESNLLQKTRPIYEQLHDTARDAISQPDKKEIDVPVKFDDNPGVLHLKMLPCNLEGRWNGYVVLSSEAYDKIRNNNVNTCTSSLFSSVRYEDISYGPTIQEDGNIMVGFDTVHIYNKIPTGVHPITYTSERLYGFMMYVLALILDIKDFDYKLPEDFSNIW